MAAVDNVSSSDYIASLVNKGSKNNDLSDTAAMQERFLTLLIAQINNQDPLNPMDNAQMTTQMAQINTVSGITQLNETVEGLTGQFSAMQVLQGASLVGRQVLVEGNQLVIQYQTITGEDGEPVAKPYAMGAIELAGPADNVKIEILGPGGQVVGTINGGAQTAGRHEFAWDASDWQGPGSPTFRVVATKGDANVPVTRLINSVVTSVGSSNGTLEIQLQGRGTVTYSDIKAIL